MTRTSRPKGPPTASKVRSRTVSARRRTKYATSSTGRWSSRIPLGPAPRHEDGAGPLAPMDGPPPAPAHPSGLRSSPTLRPLRPLIVFGTVVLVTASLYWARDVLIPIALATLLTFLLNPVANALQRWGFGRAGSVLVVVVLAFSLVA